LNWCGCGSLESLIDGNGNVTKWIRDAQGRVTQEILADGTSRSLSYEPTTSRVQQYQDAKGQTRSYSYALDDRLLSVEYGGNLTSPTPNVSFVWDPFYPRLVSRTDGTGTTTYAYNPVDEPPALGAGRLASIDGPLANDLIGFSYDELGRVQSRSINGVPTSVVYDALSRVTNVSNALGSFVYAYDGLTRRVASVSGPNSLLRSYSYFDQSKDKQLQQILNSKAGGEQVSKFVYDYNSQNEIVSWTQQADSAPAKRYDFTYDAADQLITAILKDVGTGAVLKRYAYGYDSGENRTSEQIDDLATASTHNDVNEPTGQQSGGAPSFKGGLDEQATVTVAGQPAQVAGDNKFSGSAPVSSGTSNVAVVATDPSGNVRTSTYQVTQGSTTRTLTYDANGNLLSDGTRTFEWDGQDRLAAIVQGSQRSEFSYDAFGRRTRIVENTGVVVTSDKRLLWTGTSIAEERDSSGATTAKRYFGQGEEVGGSSYYYFRDHLGSVRELVDGTRATRARYDYDPYGRKTKLSGDLAADYGFTGIFDHAASGLALTLYRGYDASIGRWLSRDPNGMASGVNLFAYVMNRDFAGSGRETS
jgi:RHS repeat-associated protein